MNLETSKPQTPYEALGGREVIERIVNRFYDLVDQEPQYSELRQMHAADLGPMRHSLAGWLTAWAGGPKDWFDENPGKCMMSAHRGLGVSKQTASQWAEAMARAIDESGPIEPKLANAMSARLHLMAHAMVAE
ncbi:globin [Altererythrobacter sp.]|uniref:globin domain-containing protein n=1 Tax=Altererythrobacter sp. TaxID=1872480 RepID=UPI003D066F24